MDYSAHVNHPDGVELSDAMKTVYAYWQRIRGLAFAPAWRNFDWLDLPPEFLPWFAVTDVHYDPEDLRYRYFGSARVRLQGRDYTGRSLRDVQPKALADKVYDDTWQVVERQSPLFFKTSGSPSPQFPEPVEYHFIRLPMSDTGDRVDHVLAFGMLEEDQIKRLNNFFEPREDGLSRRA